MNLMSDGGNESCVCCDAFDDLNDLSVRQDSEAPGNEVKVEKRELTEQLERTLCHQKEKNNSLVFQHC